MLGELIPVGGGDPIPLLKKKLLVGRRESCDIVLRFPNVSAHHCQLRVDGGYWYVKDMNSRNGVFVNDRRIEGEVELKEGDVIRIGGAQLFYMDQDFDDAQSALHHYKKVGERSRPTIVE